MAETIFSSSYDGKYSPENVLTVSPKEFWVSTGLFPQELSIQLDDESVVNSASLVTYGVKKIMIETCENTSAVNFTKQASMQDVPFKENKLQEFFLNFSSPKTTKIIKITVLEGYDEFCSINYISLK
jgi:heat shock protein beta-11